MVFIPIAILGDAGANSEAEDWLRFSRLLVVEPLGVQILERRIGCADLENFAAANRRPLVRLFSAVRTPMRVFFIQLGASRRFPRHHISYDAYGAVVTISLR